MTEDGIGRGVYSEQWKQWQMSYVFTAVETVSEREEFAVSTGNELSIQ